MVTEMVLAGQLNPHVEKIFPAEEIGKAHELLESRNSKGKIGIHW